MALPKGSKEPKQQRPPTVEENLAQEVVKKFNETFPGHNPVDYITALDMLTDQGGEAKLANPVDISDVPDRPTDLDMWQDRTGKMVCGTCMYFLEKGVDTDLKPIGACKRNAPAMDGYPRVYLTEPGCGRHKIKVYTPA